MMKNRNERYKTDVPVTREQAIAEALENQIKLQQMITPEAQVWAKYVQEITDFISTKLSEKTESEREEILNKMGVKENILSRLLSGNGEPTLRTLAELSIALGEDIIVIPTT